MPIDHTARPGECITSISDEHGFYWGTIWDHPRNTALKNLRKDPNTLAPGDIVVIPEKREKEVSVNTGAVHKFKKRGIPAQIRLQLFDGEEYRADQEFEFIVDRQHRHTGKTDAEGVLMIDISPLAKKGTLTIGPDKEKYEFNFGHLPPEDTLAGVKARLKNLGFYYGEVNDELDDVTRDALLAFQRRFDLEETGENDQATRERVEQLHDGVEDFPQEQEESNEETVEVLPDEEE